MLHLNAMRYANVLCLPNAVLLSTPVLAPPPLNPSFPGHALLPLPLRDDEGARLERRQVERLGRPVAVVGVAEVVVVLAWNVRGGGKESKRQNMSFDSVDTGIA